MTVEGKNRLVAIGLVVKRILLGTLTRAAYGSCGASAAANRLIMLL